MCDFAAYCGASATPMMREEMKRRLMECFAEPVSTRYLSNQNQSLTCFQLCSDLVSQNLTTCLFCERVQDILIPTHPDQQEVQPEMCSLPVQGSQSGIVPP